MSAKTIIFDFGGVLIDWNPRYLYKNIFDDPEKMEWFLANICTMEWNLSMDAGKPFKQGVNERIAIHPEWKPQIEAFHHRWPEMLGGSIAGSVEILEKLICNGYKVLGLTNWSAETFPVARQLFPFLNHLHGIVVSGEEKLVKPDPEIFNLLLQRYSLDAEQCIFIDDNPENIAVASKLGFDSILFTTPENLAHDLSLRGIIQ